MLSGARCACLVVTVTHQLRRSSCHAPHSQSQRFHRVWTATGPASGPGRPAALETADRPIYRTDSVKPSADEPLSRRHGGPSQRIAGAELQLARTALRAADGPAAAIEADLNRNSPEEKCCKASHISASECECTANNLIAADCKGTPAIVQRAICITQSLPQQHDWPEVKISMKKQE